jgi:hypothetical protein
MNFCPAVQLFKFLASLNKLYIQCEIEFVYYKSSYANVPIVDFMSAEVKFHVQQETCIILAEDVLENFTIW